jgi:hypothetical protein
MKDQNEKAGSEGRSYRVVLLLLVGLAVMSSAVRDLNRLHQLTHELQELTLGWSDRSLFAVSAAGVTTKESACALEQESVSQRDFRWNGRIAPGQGIEIKGINGDISADASSSGEVEVVALKRSRAGEDGVTIKVVEHPRGVTICAVYPTDDPNQTTGCEPANQPRTNAPATINLRDKNVAVDFKVKVPAGVEFFGRTINGGISVDSLASNVVSHTVNGSISISTSGYASAKTVNGEIAARLGNANWSGSLEFKTVNGEINIDLPSSVNTSITAKTFNGEVSSEFPMTVLGKSNRKEMTGTIGSGGRDLILKSLNGSINLRRVG